MLLHQAGGEAGGGGLIAVKPDGLVRVWGARNSHHCVPVHNAGMASGLLCIQGG